MKSILKSRRGIVGIEAAIVLIAFIIVAAALSYVVINMGFFITQKTKETMQSGAEESLCALQLDGTVVAKTNEECYIEWIAVPVKLSAGGASVDLSNGSLTVTVYLPNATLLNLYNGIHSENRPQNRGFDLDIIIKNMSELYEMNKTDMAMFIICNGNDNPVLEPTEKAFLIIHLNQTVEGLPGARHTIADYEAVKIEVKGAKGTALTIARKAPGGMPKKAYVDLG